MKKQAMNILIIAIILFMITWTRFYVLQLTMLINEHEKEYESAKGRYMKLSLEINHLMSYERLHRVAVDSLSMHFPTGDDYAP